MSDDPATIAAIKSIEDLTAHILELLGFGKTHNDNADHAPVDELPAIQIGADGVMNGDGVRYIPTTKRGHLSQLCDGRVEGVVWHYTDTGAAPGSAQKLAERLAQPGGRQASWHILIGRDGSIWQSVPLTMGSWHAGSPSARPFVRIHGGGRDFWSLAEKGQAGVGANSLFAGIELECVGEVRRVGNTWRGWSFGRDASSPGVVVKAEEVVEVRGKFWHGYTAAQERAAERIVAALKEWGYVDRDAFSFSHAMIDPDRRTDPGPVWMEQVLPRVLERVFGRS